MSPAIAAVLALASLACACGGAKEEGRSPSTPADVPMPAGKGTQRALVLVESDAPVQKQAATPQDAELSTPRIVKKVLGDERP